MRKQNVWRHILCDDLIDTMRLLGCDNKYLDGTASDFECFREWMAAYPYMNGNSTAEKISVRLGEIFGKKLTVTDLGQSDAKEMWRAFESGTELPKHSDVKCYNDYKFSRVDICDEKQNIMFDAVDLSEKLDRCKSDGCASFEKFVKTLENINNGAFKLVTSSKDFTRPDRYHATEYFGKDISDEKDKIVIVLLQSIFELIFKNKCEIIHIEISDASHTRWVTELMKYLSLRNFCVPVFITVNEKNTPAEIREACLCYNYAIPVLPAKMRDRGQEFYAKIPSGIFAFTKG